MLLMLIDPTEEERISLEVETRRNSRTIKSRSVKRKKKNTSSAIVGSRFTPHVRNRTASRRRLQRVPVMVEEDYELAVVSGVMSSARASDAEERERERENEERDRKIFLRVWLRSLGSTPRGGVIIYSPLASVSRPLSPTRGLAPFPPSPSRLFSLRVRVALPSASLTYDLARASKR